MCFKVLLPAIILHQHNFRLLHWNVTGIDFDSTHKIMGKYYEKLNDFMDIVSEIGMTLEIPPMNLTDSLKFLNESDISFVEINSTEKFTSKEAFEKTKLIFKQLLELYQSVITSNDIPESIIGVLEEQQQWIRIECEYKNCNRLQ